MNRKISLFSAKCGDCKKPFERPSLGAFSYGENTFNTIDGKHHLIVNAFESFPQKVQTLIPQSDPGIFWSVLANLADPVGQVGLTSKIVCPNCHSINIEVIEGARVGEVSVSEVSFLNASKLSNSELESHISNFVKNA